MVDVLVSNYRNHLHLNLNERYAQQKLDKSFKLEECERKQESNQLLVALKCSLSTLVFLIVCDSFLLICSMVFRCFGSLLLFRKTHKAISLMYKTMARKGGISWDLFRPSISFYLVLKKQRFNKFSYFTCR